MRASGTMGREPSWIVGMSIGVETRFWIRKGFDCLGGEAFCSGEGVGSFRRRFVEDVAEIVIVVAIVH